MSIPAELRARFTEAAKRAADQGEREAPIAPGSDTAIALGRLYAGFPEYMADRTRRSEPREAA